MASESAEIIEAHCITEFQFDFSVLFLECGICQAYYYIIFIEFEFDISAKLIIERGQTYGISEFVFELK